ncbi:MAG: oxidoreductase [Cycloclasticus sp.]|nr:oxidoreductase [Cycloclasticus sp.]MBG95948.1 oxidoreductase [Cycloclasticus sp.]HAI97695.1 oxidoreductase [Methylococcaceae bacterium]|tara:strand:+ start:595 stop:1383 length:789 start_codon:yes stop_codon:yes gene_type:complete
MDLQLKDKTAFVSGSSQGIGFAIANSLAAEGSHVIINGRSNAKLIRAKDKILNEHPQANISLFCGDLSDPQTTSKLISQQPNVDILVNALGIFEPKEFLDIPDEDWERFFNVNVLSGVRLSRAYLPQLQEKNWGRIIFISSESALQIPQEMIHYGTTKTAQLAVSRGLAEICAGTGITVNAVLPGPTRSEGVIEFIDQISDGQDFEAFEKEFFQSIRPSSLIKRFADTQEVANMVTYLCSPLASATTGAAIRVDGGVVKSCV